MKHDCDCKIRLCRIKEDCKEDKSIELIDRAECIAEDQAETECVTKKDVEDCASDCETHECPDENGKSFFDKLWDSLLRL